MSTESPTQCKLPEIVSGNPPRSVSGEPPRIVSGDSPTTPSRDSPTTLSRDSPTTLPSNSSTTLPGVSSKTLSGNSPQHLSSDADAPEQSYVKYYWIEDVEPLWRYCAGGYYPARIGEQFCSSRYCIVHKLGHGASSTIWLARDTHSAKYVAIKIAVSELGSPFESAILRSLWDKEGCTIKSDSGVALIPDILDEFVVEGPEIKGVRRKHQCLVTTVARVSMSGAKECSNGKPFQIMVARAIAAQVVQAVAGLHSRGVVHGGR